MNLTQEALGERLRDARLNLGLTQEEAAEAIGLPRTALLQMEAGNRSISTLELVRLAKLYRRDVSDFLAENEVDEDILVVLGRLAGRPLDSSSVKQEILGYFDIFREATKLEAYLGEQARPVPPDYRFPDPKGFDEAIQQGREMAKLERKRIDLGSAPIHDVADVIVRQGVWTAAAPLPDDVSGFFISHKDIGVAVLVNQNHFRGRRRFSYAHEYAHALADRARKTTATTKENSGELVEKRANAFASEFLLPEDGVVEYLDRLGKGGTSRESYCLWDVATDSAVSLEKRHESGSQRITVHDVAMLAHEYMVSYETAAYRLRDIKKIQKPELEELLGNASAGRTLIETLKLFNADQEDPEQPYLHRQVALLAIEALRREAISSGRFRDICKKIGLPANELLTTAEAGL